jgi:hypothetical protein
MAALEHFISGVLIRPWRVLMKVTADGFAPGVR